MMNHRHLALAALLSAAPLWFQAGCARKEDQIQAMQQKAEQAEKLDQQLQQASTDQAQLLGKAGIPAGPGTVTLTPEQKQALEERIRTEKGVSIQTLVQEILDRDKQIKDLTGKLDGLRASLPKPVIAKAEDRHYDLAMHFLKAHGVRDPEARRLLEKVALVDRLEPGFEVYHFFANGRYGTWVSQGKAAVSPTALAQRARDQLLGERDEAQQKSALLAAQLAQLQGEKERIEQDIAALRAEKAGLQQQNEELAARTSRQEARLNSLHYRVGELKQLKEAGLITVPVLGKDRIGPRATDASFDRDFPLQAGADSIVIHAAEVGVAQIRNVLVVPASVVKDQHYALDLSADRRTATIRILAPERFRNDKVVFAVKS